MLRTNAYDAAAQTDVGRVRDHNEDAALSRPDLGVFVVSDGMGGHEAGDWASQTIVDTISSVGVGSSLPDLESRFQERLVRAHELVAERGAELGAPVGATVVSLLTYEAEWACAWSGDSRLYRLRNGRLERISRDHTEAQALVDAGQLTPEEAAVWPRKNVITRAVGVTGDPVCEIVRGTLAADDVFLLCSDGLTEHLNDREIAEHLNTGSSAQAICATLVAEVLERGARDNVTALVVRVKPGWELE
ncbi:PP2C family protein-serine/threonine phosphatase [Jannaschia aquimarina]|uniref:Stp_2 protein n=1 Tax=Jannaschia aquimarina TaxID=935700 RepID=A0A0D1EIT4_9RHOB|nr:SpoIIE family protein phosphatase [Jannaschia aquimarina]KIT16801.1 Serine/threonine phosphatase stp [Jannaschia aquimarina]SNT23652.1 protein phosphatase [Jannaschia aquimarina]